MGCFLVMTTNDYQLADMLNQPMEFISRVNNPHTTQQEILIKTDKETGKFLRRFFSESRKSEAQQLHHIFPQKHRPFFEQKANINIHEATVLLDRTSHLQMTRKLEGYERAWDNFIDNHPGGTVEQTRQDVIRFAGQLMTYFGLGGADVVPYKKGH